MIVPSPWPSASVALTGVERSTVKVSSTSSSEVAVDGDGDGLRRLAGREISVPLRRGVVAGRGRGAVRRWRSRPSPRGRSAREADGERRVRPCRRCPRSTVTSSIASAGSASSSVMVPTPLPSAIVALTGVERLTVKVSSASSSVSPLTGTLTRLRGLAGRERRASRSQRRSRAGDVAVPFAVA